jgi:type I restriction enzyme, S subunit
MSSWPVARLGDLAAGEESAIAIGPFGSRMKADNYVSSGVRVIRGQNITDTGGLTGEYVFVSEEFATTLGSARLKEGDIVLPHRGAIGRAALVPSGEYVMSTSLMRIRLDRLRACPEYVTAFLCSNAGRQEILKFASTVGTPGIGQPLASLRQVRLPLPPIDDQHRIAGVLGVLDDLIDTSRGLVNALVAQADSVAGAHRAAGDMTTFGEVCDVYGGGTPKTSEPSYWNGDISWVTPTDITALRSPYLFTTSRRITQAGLDACSSGLHPSGSILMTSRATIGAFALAQVPTATNQGFIVVGPRLQEDRYFLFHEMRRRVPEFVNRANGSTFMELSRGTFKSLGVEWPSERDRRELASKLEPLHSAAAELERDAAEVESRREEFLPLLLSGRVRVEGVAA